MPNYDTLRLLGLEVKYPVISGLNISLPFATQISVSRAFMTGFFLFGVVSSLFCTLRFGCVAVKWASDYVRSFFNAKKFLQSHVASGADKGKQYYALIYGANRLGRAYATYLAERGFNLILIERERQPLNDLTLSIRQQLKKSRVPDIIQVVLSKFDGESLL